MSLGDLQNHSHHGWALGAKPHRIPDQPGMVFPQPLVTMEEKKKP